VSRFTARDGAQISYDDEGEGRPILLLHGLMAHRGFFSLQRPLSDTFRLVRVDMRGHGESSRAAPLTVAQLAEDVAALAERLDLEDAIGVGWSLGASVLWHVLTGPAGRRFAGAVVVDMTPCVLNQGGWGLGLSKEMCEARRAAIASDFETFATGAGHAIFRQPVCQDLQGLAEWAGAEFARNDAASIAALWDSLVAEDCRSRLRSVEQPSLVLHGAHSQLYASDTADYLVATLPQASSVEFDRSGHAPHLEQPERFNQALRLFAASLPPVLQDQLTN